MEGSSALSFVYNISRALFPRPSIDYNKEYSLTHSQKLWFAQEVGYPGTGINNCAGCMYLAKDCDFDVFELAIDIFVQSSDSIRIKFTRLEPEPKYVYLPYKKISVPRRDYSNPKASTTKKGAEHSDELMNSEEADHFHAFVNKPFEVLKLHNNTVEDLFRFELIKLQSGDSALLFNFHHLIADGASIGLSLKEIKWLYNKLQSEKVFARNTVGFGLLDGFKRRSVRSHEHLITNPVSQVSYPAYIEHEDKYKSSRSVVKDRLYWEQQFGTNASDPIALPSTATRYNDPTACPLSTARHTEKLEKQPILRFCGQVGMSPFRFYLATLAITLWKVTKKSDLIIGAPFHNRNHLGDIASVKGSIVNLIPLRIVLVGDTTAFQFCKGTIRAAVNGAKAASQYGYMEMLSDARAAGKFADPIGCLLNYIEEEASSDGDRVNFFQPGTQVVPLDVCITNFGADPDLTQMEITYHKQKYSWLDIELFATRWRSVISQLLESHDARSLKLQDIKIISPKEESQIVQNFNDTEHNFGEDGSKCIHDLFLDQIRRTPSAIACVYEDDELTYKELYGKCKILAEYLRSMGVGPEQLVGLCFERSLHLMVGLMSVLLAGGAYVPLDPTYPLDRLEYMVADSRPRIILTQSSLKHVVEKFFPDSCKSETQVLPVDNMPMFCNATTSVKTQNEGLFLKKNANALDDMPSNDSTFTVQPSNLAYVIYTSGSTGRPKGVMVSHAALVNRILWMQKEYSIDAKDRVLQKTPYSFDVSVWEFLWPLAVGAAVVFAKPNGQRDPFYLENLIQSAKITTLHFVPSMLRVYINTIMTIRTQSGPTICEKANTTSTDNANCTVRQIFCSGEALTTNCLENFGKCFPGTRLYNLYGPTEAAIDVTFQDCTENIRRNSLSLGKHSKQAPVALSHSLSIGKPINNMKIYILESESHELLPIGVAGELHIAGVGLARGYLNREELTAEKFVVNPFSSKSDRRTNLMYKTGDLACWLPDGRIEYLGRNDDQVKIRGNRIELGEISARLSEHECVQDAVVVVVKNHDQTTPGDDGQTVLAALYTSPAEWIYALEGDVRRKILPFLIKSLPEFMVPQLLMRIDCIPLTPSGKADRRELERTVSGTLQTRSIGSIKRSLLENPVARVAPRNKIEIFLADIFQEILREEMICINDNFFNLGGTSMDAISVLTKLREREMTEAVPDFPDKFQPAISIQDIFAYPTVAELALFIAQGKNVPTDTTRSKLDAYIDLETEATLPNLNALSKNVESLRKNGSVYNLKRGPPCILLTGATGFIGAFLLAQLLHELPGAIIYCLVRSEDEDSGRDRILRNLKAYGLFGDDVIMNGDESRSLYLTRNHIPLVNEHTFSMRVKVVPGDLAKTPNFGIAESNCVVPQKQLEAQENPHLNCAASLEPVSYAYMENNVDCIFHAATYMSFVAPYSDMKKTNVDAVRELLSFATTGKLKKVIYLSTLDVWSADAGTATKSARASLDHELHRYRDGYAGTKWIAECILLKAMNSIPDLPIQIHRLGQACGDCRSGVCPANQEFTELLDACIELQCYFQDLPLPIVPVDFLARSICALSLCEVGSATYQFTNPHHLTLATAFENNTHLDKVSLHQWLQRAKQYRIISGGKDLDVVKFFMPGVLDLDKEALAVVVEKEYTRRFALASDAETYKRLDTVQKERGGPTVSEASIAFPGNEVLEKEYFPRYFKSLNRSMGGLVDVKPQEKDKTTLTKRVSEVIG